MVSSSRPSRSRRSASDGLLIAYLHRYPPEDTLRHPCDTCRTRHTQWPTSPIGNIAWRVAWPKSRPRRAMAATLPSAAVRPGLRAPHQPARPLAGGLVVLPHDDAPLDRGDVALGPLDQPLAAGREVLDHPGRDRKSTRLNSSHVKISYAVF